MNKKDVIMKRMRDKKLSKYACKDQDAILLEPEEEDIRPRFFRDADRIIYSLSYTRYIDKTQVFTFSGNDNTSKRMTHVQFVSKIARTIGRSLGLNEDLIEAASLGHDLGHTPFGHVGENILNEISLKNGEGVFAHNLQSVRMLMNLENNGKGRNISIQVLDSIMCHNGEILEGKYCPVKKTKEEFLREYNECYLNKSLIKELRPMTLEGCVVRISDIIGYIGKDIEDALRLGFIDENIIPSGITSILGNNNRDIVNTITLDVINNSYNKSYIKMSSRVYDALNELKKFNYDNIYNKENPKDKIDEYKYMINKLFDYYINVLANEDKTNDIYTVYLKNMTDEYINNTTNVRKVLDYISGMTDNYFIKKFNKIKDCELH